MLIIITCLIIFITYICIISYLAYIFLKERRIFNNIFSDNLKYIFDYIFCPYHEILFGFINLIKNDEFNNKYECSLCKIDLDETNIYLEQLEILSEIYKLYNNINKNNIIDKVDILEYDKFKWLLDGSIRDYESIKDERIEVYEQLKIAYLSSNNKNGENMANISLENLIYLEDNIKIFNEILNFINSNITKIINFKSMFLISFILDIQKYFTNIIINYNSKYIF